MLSINIPVDTKLNFMLRLLNKVSQVAIYVGWQFCILKFQDHFYPIFSSSENFGFKLPPHLRFYESSKKIRRSYYFFATQ